MTIVAVAEGARPQGGERALRERVADSPDPIRLGGIGKTVEQALKERVASEVRTTTLGHMQRGGAPTAHDRNLSTLFGAHAAALVAEGAFGRMVAIRNGHLASVPIESVANRTRTVPPNAPMLAAGLAVGTSFGVPDLQVELADALPISVD